MRVLMSALALMLVACGGAEGTDGGAAIDAGAAADAGTNDAGATGDAGPGDDGGVADAGVDAGTTRDAGGDAGAAMDSGTDAGSPSDGGLDASVDAGPPLPTGTPGCVSDAQCAEGICWDFADVDPACGGTVCSLGCTTNTECQNAASAAGAGNPDGARCGSDGRCDFVATGLAPFFCS